MSETMGFFTRFDASLKTTKPKRDGLSEETLKKLGPSAVANLNPLAKNPNLAPMGSDSPDIYVLGLAPSQAEDAAGKYFADDPGKLFLSTLPAGWMSKMRVNSLVPIWPGQKVIGPVATEAYRSTVEADIAESKPKIILGFGQPVLNWILGKIKDKNAEIGSCTGRFFPVEIGGHKCWFMPAYSQRQIHEWVYGPRVLKNGQFNADTYSVRKADWQNTKYLKCFDRKGRMLAPNWKHQIDSVFRRARSDRAPKILDADEFQKGVRVIQSNDEGLAKLRKLVRGSIRSGRFATDIETSGKQICGSKVPRPYDPSSRLLTIGITDARGKTYAFCYDHPLEPWSNENFDEVKRLVKKLVYADVVKIAHNLPYEAEWFGYYFGRECLAKGEWHCTLAQAYILDDRAGALSLQFLNILNFGLRLKDIVQLDMANLDKEDPQEVKFYNALDAKGTNPLFDAQAKALEKSGQIGAYTLQRQRVLPLVNAQLMGAPVNQKRNAELRVEYAARIKKLNERIQALSSVKKFCKKYQEFNPDAPADTMKLFVEFKGKKPTKNGKGKFSADEEQLNLWGGTTAKIILEYRKLAKLNSTYCQGLNKDSEKTFIWPDGKVHQLFNITKVVTGRISSEAPNMNNLPKRSVEGKRIRVQFDPGEGWSVVSVDQGQIEYRVIGMMSGDKTILDSLFNGEDVHAECTKKIIEAWPEILLKPEYQKYDNEKDRFKAIRTDMKTQWVFSAFYGASFESRIRYLEAPENHPGLRKVDVWFWTKFAGVKKWQQKLLEEYNQKGYAESQYGRRRQGPLTPFQIYNGPVQSAANDVVMDSMYRLFIKSVELNKPHLAPILNIYDDLTTIVPTKDVDFYVNEIVKEMLRCDFKWVNAPLLVEASVGPDLFSTKEYCKKESDHGRKAA